MLNETDDEIQSCFTPFIDTNDAEILLKTLIDKHE